MSESSSRVVGPVTLIVSDLARSLDFYQSALGLQLHSRNQNTATLGVGADDLLVLEERPNAPRPRHSTGLYHVAILLPSRQALARQVAHFVEHGIPLQGVADHLVSEALYLADPDGNGLEIYRDRPREQWKYDAGQIRMTTDPLDVEDLMSDLGNEGDAWQGMPPGTSVGHVHLRVSDLPKAEQFYRNVLGFDLMTRYGNAASFLSKAGYHHHLGLNTWQSLGAPPAPAGAIGLKHFVHHVDSQSLEKIKTASAAHQAPVDETSSGPMLTDPSGNRILLARLDR